MAMREIAEAAGVSLKTVSRVFNEDPHVRPEIRARVKAAMEAEKYVPNTLGTSLRTGRSDVIGLAVPDVTDPFFAAVVKAADELAIARGMSIIVTSLGSDPAREPELVQSLLRRRLYGLLLAPTSADQRYMADFLEHTPVVFVDRPPVGIRADSFTDDDRGGANLATRHLLEKGHRRIAFIGENPGLPTTRARLAGYRMALTDAGIAFDENLVARTVSDRSSADDAVRGFLEHGPIDALFSCSPRCSMAVVPAVQAHRFAVVGFGDFPLADLLDPSFTVVDQDPCHLGRLAVQRLFDRRDAPTRRYPRRTTLPVTLIERDSSHA
jgi:LacI family transcriptional regulator